MLTGFKPKEQNIETPYLGELDGELKLVGLSGKQRLDLEDQASVNDTLNVQKFLALCIASCLCERSTGKPIFSTVDVLGPSGNGDGLANELDSDVYLKLIKQISTFVGKNKTAEEKKATSEQTSGGSDTSPLPQDSEGQSGNSSTPSTVQS